MKIAYEYSHLGGSEILQVRYPEINREINEIIQSINPPKTKKSKEKTKKDQLLYSPSATNELFRKEFNKLGFVESKQKFKVEIPNYPITYDGYKQIDFVKSEVFIEVQFGKYAFMFYDMPKFQYFFNENKAKVGVEIVPSSVMAKKMSTGVSKGEALIYDLERLKRHFPAVPVKIILVEPDTNI